MSLNVFIECLIKTLTKFPITFRNGGLILIFLMIVESVNRDERFRNDKVFKFLNI